MKKWIQRTAIVVFGLAGAAVTAVVVAAQVGEQKAQRRVDIALTPVALRSDAASVERGQYLYRSRGCADCHGVDGAGRDVIDDGKGLLVHAPNITPAPGSATTAYGADDWQRTIRHGVAPGGRPLMIMPSEDYNRLTDDDLASVVAYVRQMPPAQGGGAVLHLPLPLRALYGVGMIKDAAEKIDHSLPPAQPVPEGVTPEHGAYVANACIGCHGKHLSGGRIPGAPPEWPAAANLTPGEGSALKAYANADAFLAMMRTGKRPDGSAVSTVMPFAALTAMNETDVRALYLHLKGLPPRPAGER
jgi:mono/diheme cytochrome c family protein